MIGLMKQMLCKAVGNAHLTMEEMEKVLLDIEVTLNNRPLAYVEDDREQLILAPWNYNINRNNMPKNPLLYA